MMPEKEQAKGFPELESAAFNPELLRVARVARGLTQTELGEKVGVKQHAVSRWEDGLRVPDPEDVQKISCALGRTLDFFYQTDRLCGVETSFMFRRRQRTPLNLVKQIEARINVCIMGLRRALRNIEELPVRFEPMDVEDEQYEDPEQIARLTRAAWQLPFGPIPNLVNLVESVGGIVFPVDFGTSDIDAVGVWPWDTPPLFFLNPSAPADRARFNLAHEVGHVIMHRIPTPAMEKEADRFASEFLMPTKDIKAELTDINLQKALRLKLRWRVSAQSIIRKARDTGVITERKFQSLNAFISKKGYRKSEPNPIAPEQPTTLYRLLKGVYLQHLGYQVGDVARLTYYTNVEEFLVELLREKPPNDPTNHLRVVG